MLKRFSEFLLGIDRTHNTPPPVTRERMMQKRWWAVFKRFPDRPPLVGAELGVANANMSQWLLAYTPSIHMTLVDVRYTEAAKAILRRFPEETWDFYHMPTHEAAALVPDAHFDFVFIDADHSYASVRRDIQDWLPKVKVGGWLCGHDFNKKFTDDDRVTKYAVKKAVEELCPGYETDVNDTWFYKRR